MKPLQVDDSQFPLVYVVARGTPTDQEFDAYLEELAALYRRRERFALVVDASRSGGATAAQRKKQADWIKQNAMMIQALNLGTAFVVPSALARGVMTAILWLQPMPSPHLVCNSPPEGVRWASEQLRQAGIEPPDSAFSSSPPDGLSQDG